VGLLPELLPPQLEIVMATPLNTAMADATVNSRRSSVLLSFIEASDQTVPHVSSVH
jgi:hypothetical protein